MKAMFVRTELQHRLVPMWKRTNYLNLSNVLRLEVEKNTVTFFTIFRPLRPAGTIQFKSHKEAIAWANQTLPSSSLATPGPATRLDEASPDPLALQALADWDEEKKLK